MVNVYAFCINMDRRPDRWSKFKSYDWGDTRIERIPAVDGKTLDRGDPRISEETRRALERQASTGGRRTHAETTWGGVGCTLSHLHAWQRGLEVSMPGDLILIFEDDAHPVSPGFAEQVRRELEYEDEFDILLLGCLRRGVWNGNVYDFQQTHAYILTRGAAEFLCDRILPVGTQLDHEMSEMAQRGLLRIRCTSKNLAGQGGHGTDIQKPLLKSS